MISSSCSRAAALPRWRFREYLRVGGGITSAGKLAQMQLVVLWVSLAGFE